MFSYNHFCRDDLKIPLPSKPFELGPSNFLGQTSGTVALWKWTQNGGCLKFLKDLDFQSLTAHLEACKNHGFSGRLIIYLKLLSRHLPLFKTAQIRWMLSVILHPKFVMAFCLVFLVALHAKLWFLLYMPPNPLSGIRHPSIHYSANSSCSPESPHSQGHSTRYLH